MPRTCRVPPTASTPPARRTAPLRGRAVARRCALACALALVQAARAESGDSTEFSFEQLTSMEVSGVSKSAERALDAPAAVTVVTAAEIRAYGWRTLGDLLAAAPGFLAYSDRMQSYVGVRGFAPVDAFNSRVLLLIDGFPANDTVYQQANLGNEGLVDLDLIDRVEIIPGPSSSVYGTNAFLGVINVVLKSPSQQPSGAQAWAGSGAERGATATMSAAASSDTRYLLQASASGAQGLDVVLPSQSGLPGGARVSGADGTDVARAFAKVVSGNLRVNLGFSDRRQGTGYGQFGDVIGDPRSWVRDGTSFADARYEGTAGNATDYSLRASVAEYRHDATIVDPYPPGLGLPPTLAGFLPAVGDWLDLEATATHHFSAQNRLVVGTELRRDWRESMTYSNDVQGTFLDARNAASLAGVYAQSDIDWSPQFATSLGLRDDDDSGQPNRLSPRIALLWKPTAWQSLKLMSGSAFRDPAFWEAYFAQPPLNLPNAGLRPEHLRTLDLQYQAQVAAVTSVSLTVFRYRAENLIDEELVDPAYGTLQFRNDASASARGGDLAVDSRPLPELRLRLAAEYVYSNDADGNWEPNSPLWTGRLGVEGTLPADWRLAGETLFEARRQALDGNVLPAALVANLSLSSPQGPGRPDVAVGVYNLFDRTVLQPVAGWQVDSVQQPGRTWRVTVGYRF
jgi:iron complex outermembrane receptor protein